MIFSFFNNRRVHREVLKTLGYDLANANEWKIMFDPSIVHVLTFFFKLESSLTLDNSP